MAIIKNTWPSTFEAPEAPSVKHIPFKLEGKASLNQAHLWANGKKLDS